MQSTATTVEDYIAALPSDRREAIEAVRAAIRTNLPEGYEEGMQSGMIGYYVPHSIYPAGYHAKPSDPLPFLSLASQKSHMALYLMCVYSDPDREDWFRDAWTGAGKKLDMGQACVRFKRLDQVPLEVVGELVAQVPVAQFVEEYEVLLEATGVKRKAAPAAKKKAPAKKKAAPAAKKKAAPAAKKKAPAAKKKAAAKK